MAILVCLLNLVIWAMIILFVLWIVTLVLSMFIPGVPMLIPFPGSPAVAGGSRVLSLLYLAIGLILLINFLICAFGGGATLLPMLWTGGMERSLR